MGAEMMPQPPPAIAPPIFEPKRIKVLGVMDLVFGGLGCMMLLWQVVGLVFQEKFTELSSTGQPPEMAEFQRRLTENTVVSSWVGILLGVIVTVLVLMAGMSLVRKTKNCVKMSNIYAVASIGAKVIAVIVFLTVVNPAIAEALKAIPNADRPEVKTLVNVMKISMVAAGLLGPILMAIYPILCLILLNKPVVKDYLAQQGAGAA